MRNIEDLHPPISNALVLLSGAEVRKAKLGDGNGGQEWTRICETA